MEKLLKILNDIKPDVDFSSEEGLIDNEVFDSFDIVQLVGQISSEFDIEITPNDILPENFNSAEAMWQMIERLSK
ncbi:MAG: acyl carrier protein [Spirochaetia bacterium]|nr:acyl carrier protein [Spirochaetia bacterium]MDD7697788.1 acyl carrier protein [Spirochaetia bacterium]MDY4210493.1 acyl carrier protein [Treponema sp.]